MFMQGKKGKGRHLYSALIHASFAVLNGASHFTRRSQDLYILNSFSTPQGAYTPAAKAQGGDNCPHSFPFTAGWTGGSCLTMPKAGLEPATPELRISSSTN